LFAAASFPIILFEAVSDEIFSVIIQECEVFVLEDSIVRGVLVEGLDLVDEGIDVVFVREGLPTAEQHVGNHSD